MANVPPKKVVPVKKDGKPAPKKQPSPDQLRKMLDPNLSGKTYNLPIVTMDGINSFPGWCLDYHYCVLTSREISPMVLPAVLGAQANATFQPVESVLIRDIRAVPLDSADFLLLRDNRNIRYMQNNQTVIRGTVAPPFPVWWYDAPTFNVAATGKWQLNVQLTNGTALAHNTYFAFPSLVEHKYGPLMKPAFRKTLIQKSAPFILQADFTFAPGIEFQTITFEINRACIFIGASFLGATDYYLMEATSGKDSNSIGLTAVGNPVPVELVASVSSSPLKLTWPGCYYISANDAFSVAVQRYGSLAPTDTLSIQFQGYQW